ncbi:hypothetical protein BD410DRAFT_841125 [Rickenella mellea]|uniref:F-box domain-containing protein n=1 Tax=Rickenella mellea TaxID=50990 RepID=A0A4Y7PZ86_9AGAM|nr:hypothetical protein BD410DRAFT_841125 [Rickenella mellea]
MDAQIPLQDLLHTNCLPTDIQRPYARNFVEKSTSKLSEVDADLAGSIAETTRLRLERDAISADLQRHEMLLSPARRLLSIPELIGEICLHCILDPTDQVITRNSFLLPSPYNYSCGMRDDPLTLSHVCRVWRRVALPTPRLWASFRLFADQRSIVPVNERLSRSQSHPLSFAIQLRSYDMSIQDSPVIAALAKHQNRWKYVFVNGTGSIKDFLSSVSDTYPVLEKLHLSIEAISLRGNHRCLDTAIAAPNLIQLELKGCVLISDKLSLPNLRVLIIYDSSKTTSWDYCLSMCRLHPTLEKAMFHISPTTTISSDENIVVLPSLKALHLSITFAHASVPPDASPLLVKIRAPALKKLLIRSESGVTQSIQESILPFLKRSSATLASFYLDGNYSDMGSLTEFLEHLPHLQELSLSSRHLNSDDLLTHLRKPIFKHTPNVLCAPELAVIGPIWSNPTLASMVDFIVSRSSNVTGALREVVVKSRQSADELRSHPGISECIKKGLQVIFRKSPTCSSSGY